MEIFNQLNVGYDPYDQDTYINITDDMLNEEEQIILQIQQYFQNFLIINLFFAINFRIKLICNYFYQKYKENVLKFYNEDLVSISISFILATNIVVIDNLKEFGVFIESFIFHNS